jgi:hypothetical protein
MWPMTGQVFVGVVLGFILLGIPYAIWIAHTIHRRRWRRLALQIMLPLSAIVLLLVIDATSASMRYANYLAGVFGTEVVLRAPFFEYHSSRHFNGDGYSFEVYHLPDGVRQRFAMVKKNELSNFPRRTENRSHWRTQPWIEGPLESRLNEDVEFALAYGQSGNPELGKHLADLRQAFTRPRTFYAYHAYDHSQALGNIDLFVIDLEVGRLYLINLNT